MIGECCRDGCIQVRRDCLRSGLRPTGPLPLAFRDRSGPDARLLFDDLMNGFDQVRCHLFHGGEKSGFCVLRVGGEKFDEVSSMP